MRPGKATVTAIAVLVLCAALACARPAAAQMKIGFVDLQRVLDMTDRGKQIMRDLSSLKDNLELQEQTKKLEILKLEDDLRKTGDALSEQAFQEKAADLEKKYYEYQSFVANAQIDFQKKKVEWLKAFIKDIQAIATQIAGEQGYSMILLKIEDVFTESSLILFADPAYDLTDEVIRRINAKGTGRPK